MSRFTKIAKTKKRQHGRRREGLGRSWIEREEKGTGKRKRRRRERGRREKKRGRD